MNQRYILRNLQRLGFVGACAIKRHHNMVVQMSGTNLSQKVTHLLGIHLLGRHPMQCRRWTPSFRQFENQLSYKPASNSGTTSPGTLMLRACARGIHKIPLAHTRQHRMPLMLRSFSCCLGNRQASSKINLIRCMFVKTLMRPLAVVELKPLAEPGAQLGAALE